MQNAIQKDLGECAFDDAKKPPARSRKAKVLLGPNQGESQEGMRREGGVTRVKTPTLAIAKSVFRQITK